MASLEVSTTHTLNLGLTVNEASYLYGLLRNNPGREKPEATKHREYIWDALDSVSAILENTP